MAVSEQYIATNRVKALLLALASLAFIVLAAFFVNDPETINDGRWAMYLGMVLFIPAALLFLYIGLMRPFYFRANADGLDFSTSLGVRQTVPWEAVQGFRRGSLGGNHFVLVDVAKPHDYLKNAPNGWMKMRFRGYYKNWGTPILIEPGFLSITREDLITLLGKAYDAHSATTTIQ